MANRYMYQFKGSFEPGIVQIFGRISIGASGAPTLQLASSNPTNQNRGIASIVRNSAGNYTITMSDPYVRLMSLSNTMIATGGISAAPTVVVEQDNLSTLAAPTLIVQFSSPAGSAADPANGEIVLLNIVVKNSSV